MMPQQPVRERQIRCSLTAAVSAGQRNTFLICSEASLRRGWWHAVASHVSGGEGGDLATHP
jgi:hypothetical protein